MGVAHTCTPWLNPETHVHMCHPHMAICSYGHERTQGGPTGHKSAPNLRKSSCVAAVLIVILPET